MNMIKKKKNGCVFYIHYLLMQLWKNKLEKDLLDF